jgi:hypothetical protein
LRNSLVLGSATNRVIAFHPIGVEHLIDLAQVCWHWLGADAPLHPALTFLAALIAASVFIRGAIVVWKRPANERNLLAAMLISIATFALMLTFSISLVDYHTPIDSRVLAPTYVAWLVLVGCLLSPASGSRPKRVFAAAALFLLTWFGVRSFLVVRQFYNAGGGYAQRGIQQSAIIAAVKKLPRDKIVYTNAPGAVYLLTNFPAIITIPSEFSASSTLRNADFDAQMGAAVPGGSGPTSVKGTIKLAGLRFAGAEGGKKLDVILDTDVKGDAAAGEDVPNLADADDWQLGVDKGVEHGRRRWRHRKVAAIVGALERARLANERPRDHQPDAKFVAQFSRDLGDRVELF